MKVCIDGLQEDRECPNGLHFSPYDGKCVEPELAECDTDRKFCSAQNNNSEDFVQFKVPNSRACDQFYLCWNNKENNAIGAATFRCNTGLHVNPNSFLCELPETAGCDVSCNLNDTLSYNIFFKSSSHPAPPQYPGVNINFDCPSNGIFAHPDSCRFWFFCQDGAANIFQCSQSNYFDNNIKRCVLGPCTTAAKVSFYKYYKIV